MSKCPCNSGNEYEICCDPYLSGKTKPDTAEKLMRSRYSAYVKENIEYVDKTHHPDFGQDFDKEEALKWAQESDWQGLEILKAQDGLAKDESGVVEFRAKYKNAGKDAIHHEVANFKKQQGNWYYTEGSIVGVNPIERTGPKVGRNEPCPCGSGKKFKKCCL